MDRKYEGMPFPRILALDLDGTLLRSDHTIADRTVTALQQMRTRGCTPVISTGRSFEAVVPFLDRLDLDTPVICYNGAMICDGRNGTILQELRLPTDIAREVLHTARERDIHYQGFSEGQLYYERKRPESDFYEAHTGLSGRVVDFDSWDNLEFTKVLLIAPPDRPSREWPELHLLQQEARERYGPRLYTALSQPYYLEMIHGDSSKGLALKRLGEDLGVRQEETAAFGDGLNDLEMLEYAGISVAMGNAAAGLQGKTAYQTASNDDEGIAVFLEKHFL